MISAALLLLVGASAPVADTLATRPGETIRHSKGQMAIPAPATARAARVEAACHPDPLKGRTCRHLAYKASEARGDALARGHGHGAARPGTAR